MAEMNQLYFPTKYFEDQVMDGFFVPAIIKQEWAAGLEILHEIDRVCKNNDIQYFADWGTLLATVRHQGYIPWDDDLDICMKRADYNKFLEVAPKELPEGFEIHNFQTHDDHWLFLARVVNKGRICFEEEHLEKFHQFPYIVSVDIFVLDYVSRNEEEEEKRDKEALYTIAFADGLSEGMFSEESRNVSFQRIENYSGVKIDRSLQGNAMRRQLYSIAQDMFSKFTEEESDELSQLFPFGLKNKDFRFSKKYYEQSIELPYENTKIPVPLYYERMLKRRYGNYMHLIKEGGAHEYPYFEEQIDSLKSVLDFEMPEYIFSQDQLRANVTKDDNFSYKELIRECLEELEKLQESLFALINMGAYDELELFEILQNSQQLAIDMGTIIEAVKGEGHITIASIENYCEQLYQLSQNANGDKFGLDGLTKDLFQGLTDVVNIINKNILNKMDVVLFPVKSDQWKYLQPIYSDLRSNSEVDLYIVPIPYFYKKYDGSLISWAEEFDRKLLSNGGDTVLGDNVFILDYDKINIELMHPDRIYFQYPYDQWNPSCSVVSEFYSDKLQAACDQLIYVHSYDVADFEIEEFRSYTNTRSYISMPGVVRADEILVPTSSMQKIYIERLTEFAGKNTRKHWEHIVKVKNLTCDFENESGISTNNKIEPNRELIKKKLVFYINASFLVDNGTKGIDKLRNVLSVFLDASDRIDILYCPHQQLEQTTKMISNDLWNQYQEIIDTYIISTWFKVITDLEEQKRVINKADAYYGDGGYMAHNMAQLKKPVMLLNIKE